MPRLDFGGYDVIDGGAANEYASYPFAFVTERGSRLVAYRNGDGVNPIGHASGSGSFWLQRNEGVVQKLWSQGGTLTEPVLIPMLWGVPGQPDRVVAHVGSYVDGGTPTTTYRLYYAVSTDDGATWPASLTAMPAFTGLAVGTGPFQLTDAFWSGDRTKIYVVAYFTEPGTPAGQEWRSSALFESTDGINFAFRSWLFRRTDANPANEVGITRITSNHLLAIGRNATLNGFPVVTKVSRDDGSTWSAPALQPSTCGIVSVPRGYPINEDDVAVVGRNMIGSFLQGQNLAVWHFDGDGAFKGNAYNWHYLNHPNDGGYAGFQWHPKLGLTVIAHTDRGIAEVPPRPSVVRAPVGVRSG